MAPSVPSGSTQYALVIDAGSSGSRLQIYSWRNPILEHDEIVAEVRAARAAGVGSGAGESSTGKWWWWDSLRGKLGATEAEMEQRALRRLARVGKGVNGDDWVKRVEPGISTVSPEEITAYLEPMLQHALDHIPPSQQSRTPIYVLATAGMRLLNDETQSAILQAACDTLRRDYPFVVDDPSSLGPCGDSVRVISGEEEGIWGWVAVNYLMDGFGHAPERNHEEGVTEHDHLLPLADLAEAPQGGSSGSSVTPVDIHKHSPTFGFLDMGGASTQIAFAPSQEEIDNSGFPRDELSTISLRLLSGEVVEWPVFAHSWLGYGTNRVRERYTESLISQWKQDQGAAGITDKTAPIRDVCLHTGLHIPAPEGSEHPGFAGAGSFSDCLSALKPLIEQGEDCTAKTCLFGGTPTPQIDFHRHDQRGFIGISEYWYTSQQVLGLGGVWDWSEWEQAMGKFCAEHWNDVEDKTKAGQQWSDIDRSRMRMQCFKGAWISNVLHEGIGIPRLVDKGGNDTLTGGQVGDTNTEAERRAKEKGLFNKPHFQSMDEVDETAISWTLGKVVLEASRAVSPASGQDWTPRKIMEKTVGDLTPHMMVYLVVASLVLGFLFRTLRKRASFGVRRARKLSATNGGRLPALSSISRLIPSWVPGFATPDAYSMEEVGGLGFGQETKAHGSPGGRLRLWSRRVGNALRRNVSFGGHELSRKPRRQVSTPLPTPLTTSGYFSQPSSPGNSGSSYFPGPPRFPRSLSGTVRSLSTLDGTATTPSSPPRGGRSAPPMPPRSNSTSFLDPNTSGGWNDPPLSLFSTPTKGHSTSHMPGAAAAAAAAAVVGGNAPGYDSSSGEEYGFPKSASHKLRRTGTSTPTGDSALSRNSSRVNLGDLSGLAQRTASRNVTPQRHGHEDGTP